MRAGVGSKEAEKITHPAARFARVDPPLPGEGEEAHSLAKSPKQIRRHRELR
jgi:hypothetical protein